MLLLLLLLVSADNAAAIAATLLHPLFHFIFAVFRAAPIANYLLTGDPPFKDANKTCILVACTWEYSVLRLELCTELQVFRFGARIVSPNSEYIGSGGVRFCLLRELKNENQIDSENGTELVSFHVCMPMCLWFKRARHYYCRCCRPCPHARRLPHLMKRWFGAVAVVDFSISKILFSIRLGSLCSDGLCVIFRLSYFPSSFRCVHKRVVLLHWLLCAWIKSLEALPVQTRAR